MSFASLPFSVSSLLSELLRLFAILTLFSIELSVFAISVVSFGF